MDHPQIEKQENLISNTQVNYYIFRNTLLVLILLAFNSMPFGRVIGLQLLRHYFVENVLYSVIVSITEVLLLLL